MRSRRPFFYRGLDKIVNRLESKYVLGRRLLKVRDKLLERFKLGLVNFNHAALEITLAAHLLYMGFHVDVEHEVEDKVVDVYAVKEADLSAEVETGYVPFKSAHNPLDFLASRIASKAVRYSGTASKFLIAVPPYYIPPIPEPLLKDPSERTEQDVIHLSQLAFRYSTLPKFSESTVRSSKLDGVIVINVDDLEVRLLSPFTFKSISELLYNA
jgi:hypothetical protein